VRSFETSNVSNEHSTHHLGHEQLVCSKKVLRCKYNMIEVIVDQLKIVVHIR
jgi:hypothetical protein